MAPVETSPLQREHGLQDLAIEKKIGATTREVYTDRARGARLKRASGAIENRGEGVPEVVPQWPTWDDIIAAP